MVCCDSRACRVDAFAHGAARQLTQHCRSCVENDVCGLVVARCVFAVAVRSLFTGWVVIMACNVLLSPETPACAVCFGRQPMRCHNRCMCVPVCLCAVCDALHSSFQETLTKVAGPAYYLSHTPVGAHSNDDWTCCYEVCSSLVYLYGVWCFVRWS